MAETTERRTLGRPTKLTPELTDEIVKLVGLGNYIETAAAFSGLSKQTIYNWLRRGRREIDRVGAGSRSRKIRKKEALCVEFVDAITRARAEFEVTALHKINVASNEDWKAAAWRLERLNPQRYGPVELIVGDITVGEVEKSALSDDERLLRIQSLLQRVRHKAEHGETSTDHD